MPTENLGSLFYKIEAGDFASGTAKKVTGNMSVLQKQIASTALGFIGANGFNMAIGTATRLMTGMVKSSMGLETAMAEVSTLVDTQKVNIAGLTKGVEELSVKYGQDAGGLAAALYQTVSAGIDATEALEFLEVATQAAIGGVTETAIAVDTLTSIINAFGLETKDARDVSDSLFVTIKRGKTTMAELAPIMGRIAPLASAVGLSMDEMNNSIATLTKIMPTREAGTGFKAMMKGILKPSEQATNFIKTLNEEIEGLNLEMSIQGVEAAGGYTKWMEKLNVATGGSGDAMKFLFEDVEGMSAAMFLAGEGAFLLAEGMREQALRIGESEKATVKLMATSFLMGEQFKMFWVNIGRTIGGFVNDLFVKTSVVIKMMGATKKEQEKLSLIYAEYLKLRKEGNDVDAKANEEQERRNKLIEEYKQRNKAVKESIQGIIDKHKEEGDAKAGLIKKEKEQLRLAKEREKQEALILAIVKENNELLHEQLIKDFNEQIKLHENLGQKEKETFTHRLFHINKAHQLRARKARIEADFEQDLLVSEFDRRKDGQEANAVYLAELINWYNTASENIEMNWGHEVTKNLKIKAVAELEAGGIDQVTESIVKIQIEAQKKTARHWSRQMNGVVDGFSQMLSGEFEDIVNALGDIAAEVGGSYGTIVDAVLGVLKLGFDIGTKIGQAYIDDRDKEVNFLIKWAKASEEINEAADKFNEGVDAYIDSLQNTDLSQMSDNEILAVIDQITKEQLSALQEILGVDVGQSQLENMLQLLGQAGIPFGDATGKGDIEALNAFEGLMKLGFDGIQSLIKGIDAGLGFEELNEQINGTTGQELSPEAFAMLGTLGPILPRLADLLKQMGLSSDTPETSSGNIISQLSQILLFGDLADEKKKFQEGLYNKDLNYTEAGSFEGGIDLLQLLQREQNESELWYQTRRMWLANKFRRDLTDAEYRAIQLDLADAQNTGTNTTGTDEDGNPIFDDGGISTGPGRVSMDGKAELILPLEKPGRLNQILSSLEGITGGMGGNRTFRVSLAIDPNIPITAQTAEVMGGSIAKNIVAYEKAKSGGYV